MCEKHYARVRRNGHADLMVVRVAGRTCTWTGCSVAVFAKDLCELHYRRLSNARYKARVNAAIVGSYGPRQITDRFAYFDNKCWMCGSSGPLTIDHVKPITRGGKDCPSNFRPACQPCNSRKSNHWFGVSELHRFLKT